jgi:hypothetical protein
VVDFGDVGRICLNGEISGDCQNCLWWEWDSKKQRCANSQYHVCPVYREGLFNLSAKLLRQEFQAKGTPRPSGVELAGPPAAKAGEPGTS